jgi:hypothetical protein
MYLSVGGRSAGLDFSPLMIYDIVGDYSGGIPTRDNMQLEKHCTQIYSCHDISLLRGLVGSWFTPGGALGYKVMGRSHIHKKNHQYNQLPLCSTALPVNLDNSEHLGTYSKLTIPVANSNSAASKSGSTSLFRLSTFRFRNHA